MTQEPNNSDFADVLGGTAAPGVAKDTKAKPIFMDGFEDEAKAYQSVVEEHQIAAAQVKLPKGYLSVSQVNMYLRCPKSYEHRYVYDKIRKPKARMTEGSAIHKALEVAHRARKDTGLTAKLDHMREAYHAYWQEKRSEVEYEDETEDTIIKRDERFLELYHREFIPKIIPVQVEQRFFVTLTELNIPVMGFIDLVDSGEEDHMHTVVDHKVVDRAKTVAMANGDMQLTLYTHVTGLPKARFDMFIKTKTPKIQELRTVRFSRDIRWVEEVFKGVAAGINAGIFPPCDPTSWMCNSEQCGYWSECRGKI